MIVDHLEQLPESFKDYHLVVSTVNINISK